MFFRNSAKNTIIYDLAFKMSMLSDIDLKLSMSFSISFEVNSFILSSVVDPSSYIPLNIHVSNDKYNIDLFMENVSVPKEVYDVFIPVKIGRSVILSEVVNSVPLRRLLETLESMNSLVLNELYSWNKQIFVTCRFHESEKRSVTDLMRELSSSDESVNLLRLGRTEGLRHSLDSVDSRIKLSAILFSYREKKEDGKYFLEWRGTEGETDAVVYPAGPDEQPVFSSIKSKPISRALSNILKDRLPIASYLEEHSGGLVNCVAIVPSDIVNSFMVRFAVSESEFMEFGADAIYPYSEAKNIL